MEFGDNDVLHNLERPPSRTNLSKYNILQIILMIYLGCSAGFNIYSILTQKQISKSNIVEIIFDSLLFIGFIASTYGFLSENNGYLKGGFIIFCFGCVILIIKIIVDWIKGMFSIYHLIEFLVAIFIVFVITKQIQHL